MNEFYEVGFEWGETYYFRDKDKAFEFAWQSYLNNASYNTEEEMEADRKSLNEDYRIDNFVYIDVKGFED